MEQKPFIRAAVFLGPAISTATSRNVKLRDASRTGGEGSEREGGEGRGEADTGRAFISVH